jgi:hypothetical protein
MILINNYKVDMPDNANAKYAVFTIEFEKDNRLYVGHVLNRSVISAVTALVLNAFDNYSSAGNSSISQAIRESKYITVELVKSNIHDLDWLFSLKYKTIMANKSFIPYGYNQINLSSAKSQEEKKVIKELLTAFPDIRSFSLCKPVYRINQNTGESTLFNSAKEAAEAIGGKPSNITACCRGLLHTAYGYAWCYVNSLDTLRK